MPYPTFTPPLAPSPGTSTSVRPALYEVSFGDGYSQASPRGLNHVRRTVSYRWDALTQAQAKEIEDFFTAQGGYKPFWWRRRGDAALSKWRCKDWTVTDSTPYQVTATFEEWFGQEV